MADETTRMDPVGSDDPTTAIPARRAAPATPPVDDRPVVELLQWLGWPLGGAMVVWSLVALARIGFEGYDPYAATTVASLGVSRLLAVVVLILALFIWSGVARTDTNTIGLRTLGAVGVVIGLVLLIEPGPFQPYLGIQDDSFGLTSAIIGALLVGASLVQPFRVGTRP